MPFIKLKKIFRQAQKSRIITNAHKINKGEMPYLKNTESYFMFMELEEDEKAAEMIVHICSPIMYNLEGVQVLTPMRRRTTGITNLKQLLQTALNPNGTGLKMAGIEYWL